MSMKLFDAVSMEENQETVGTIFDVETIIGMEDADHDVAIAANEVTTGIAMMDAALEVAANIEEQVAVEEAILDAGTATAGIAQLAMANLQSNARMLGLESADYAISAESMEANPATALKVSVESAKETFQKIMKQIKEFFSKMWSKIKSLTAKTMLAITDYEKKFKALGEAAAKLSDSKKEGVKDNYSEAEGKKIVSKFFAGMALSGGKIPAEKVEKSYGKDVFKQRSQFLESVIEALDTEKSGDIASKQINDEIVKEMNKYYDGLPSGTNDSHVYVVSREDGTTIKGSLIKVERVKIGENEYPKVVMSSFSGTAKKDIIAKYSKDLKVISVSDIKSVCDAGLALAKSKELFKGYSESVLSKTDKAIGKTPKSKKDGEQDKLNSLYSSSLSTVNTAALKFSSDILLGYVATLKNAAFLAQVSMAKYEAKK